MTSSCILNVLELFLSTNHFLFFCFRDYIDECGYFSTDRDGMANLNLFCIDGRHIDCAEMLSKNDGLTVEDWRNWFKDYDLSLPLVIIHFTPFRY